MQSKVIQAQYIIIPYMQILENLKKQIFKSINRLVLGLQKNVEKIWGTKIIKLHPIFGGACTFKRYFFLISWTVGFFPILLQDCIFSTLDGG